MPSGERSQVWFPEIVAILRSQWRQDLSWQSVIELRERLQYEFDKIRRSRGILPPVIHCRVCGHIGPASPPVISVRAMLIAVQRFGIDNIEASKNRQREWERYRRKNKLNLLGKLSEGGTPVSCHNTIHETN